MAHGQTIQRLNNFLHAVLLDASVAATDNGAWIDAGHYQGGSIEVTISAAGTVQIRGSNAATKPANTSHGTQIGGDVIATTMTELTGCSRWLKAMISAGNNGTITVGVVLRTFG